MKLLFMLAVPGVLAGQPGECLDSAAYVSVKEFGAVGDGKADDSAAIQAALDRAKSSARGTFVLLPPGEYRVTKTLKTEGVLLRGLEAGGWCSDVARMPTIRVDFTDGPCIAAGAGASLHGINFEYDHKGEAARVFGPTIQLGGVGISVTNVRIHQPYEAIIADGVSNLGRLNLENVFIINARKCGVYVTNTYDAATLRSVEVWNLSDYPQSHCIGFKFGKNDEIRIEHCFAFKCKIGYLFAKDKEGDTWGGMTASSADFSLEGVVVESVQSLRIVGGSLWAHGTSLRVDGPGKIIASGIDMQANLTPALVVKNCDSLAVTGCALRKSGRNWTEVFHARLEGGSNVMINGCTFDDNARGISVAESMSGFAITNNVFAPCELQDIADNSPASARKVVQGNLLRTVSAGQLTSEKPD